jgi:hypothetical protein
LAALFICRRSAAQPPASVRFRYPFGLLAQPNAEVRQRHAEHPVVFDVD